MQACGDKYLCRITEKMKTLWRLNQGDVYLNYAGVACGCLWVDRESIRLENHCGWGEHSPKNTHKETGNSKRGEENEKESRGKGRVDMHTGEQAIRLGKKKKKSPKGEPRRSKRVSGEKVKALLNLSDISEKKTQRKSTKQAVSCPGKTGYSAMKEKASERLCVHQSIM